MKLQHGTNVEENNKILNAVSIENALLTINSPLNYKFLDFENTF